MKRFSFSSLLAMVAFVTAAQPPAVQEAAERGDFSAAANLSTSLAERSRSDGNVKEAMFYDSLTLRYSRLGKDSLLTLKTLNGYALKLADAGNLGKAEALLSEAEDLLGASRAEELRWYQSKGGLAFKRFKMDDAMTHYKNGLAKAEAYGNKLQAMNFKQFIGETRLYKGATDSIHLVYEALEYFEKNRLFASAFNAASTVGKSFQFSFNPEKAAAYFQKAVGFAEQAGDKGRTMEARLSIGQVYLSQKKYAEAEAELSQASKFYQEKSAWQGLAATNVFLAQLYVETDKLEAAQRSLAVADEANAIVKSEPLKGGINIIRSLLMAKLKNFKAADSLMSSGGKALLQNMDKSLVKMAQNKMVEGHPELAKDSAGLTSFIGGVKEGAVKSLGMDSSEFKNLLNMNIYTGHPANEDSTILNAFNRQLLDVDAKYKIRIFDDSLKLKKQEAELAKKASEIANKETALVKRESESKNIIIAAGTILLALVAAGLWLQYGHRRRAERDKAYIQTLQNEIHHRVKNNLAVINRLVDVAGKNSVHDASLDALKTRIKSIELLHRHLYREEARAGNIALQPYLDDLCAAIAATFATAKDIRISVQADAEVDSAVAEKLGLIVNELVTNSFKYAFPNKEEGTIHVIANRQEKQLNLTVEDNGIGMPEERTKGSYGMKLIKGLSHELNGKFSFQNNGGTQFQLNLPV